MTIQPSKLPADGQSDTPGGETSPRRILSSFVGGLQQRAGQAVRWTKREIILVFFAAFIAGLGAGAAEALISWALP